MGKTDRYISAGLLMRERYDGARVLLVHAHPDDETINNGATMALYAALGAEVTDPHPVLLPREKGSRSTIPSPLGEGGARQRAG